MMYVLFLWVRARMELFSGPGGARQSQFGNMGRGSAFPVPVEGRHFNVCHSCMSLCGRL